VGLDVKVAPIAYPVTQYVISPCYSS
jgi:hypothetical protein